MTRSFPNYVDAFPERAAIISDGGRVHTYRDVAIRANKIGHLLEKVGYIEGDVVCALLPNGPDMLIVQRGILQLPVYFSTINWHLTPPEAAYILQDSHVRLFFTTSALEETSRAAMELAGISADVIVIVDGAEDDPRSLDALIADLPAERLHSAKAGTRRLYTSGTTGRPKAVRRPLAGISPETAAAAHVTRAALYGVDHEEGVYLSVAPMYHAAPLSYADQALELGHTVVIMPKWGAQTAIAAIEQYGVTWTYMVPLMFQEMLALPSESRSGVGTLRAIVHTAAPCPPLVKRAMIEWVGPILTELYGGTEGSATVIRSDEWLDHPGSVGRARPGVRMEIRDDDSHVLPPREIGHIYFENEAAAFVYDNDDAKTASTRVGSAVTLGDIGYIDEDGYLFLCDRKADVVISGGVNIYPAETEHALKEIEWVLDACVIGVPDERWGESLHAVVVTSADAPADEEQRTEELTAALRTRIAGFKVPRSFEYADEIPYSEAGKMLRKVVRDARAGVTVLQR
ncbi:hypothetical protein ASD65_13175 [Microbacterium sp. Root61]|uniref:AMP-binding protein n=1 Tax=Microbacterium sp. Root61 TaxID=1736570 RepID=UPI0006F7F95C|nr:AMP-binding protein [Microbacterium sp. Root61]KRA25266.1 hypothetical protein ASD65_13175 [Microbacterium sp. Root61]